VGSVPLQEHFLANTTITLGLLVNSEGRRGDGAAVRTGRYAFVRCVFVAPLSALFR